MFRTPHQSGQREQNARSPARKRDSNREKEPLFFGPSRGGCFSPPAVRPSLCRQPPPAKAQTHPSPKHRISNRKPKLLETLQLHENINRSPFLIARKHRFSHLLFGSRRSQSRPNADALRARELKAKDSAREENANPHPSVLLRLKGGPIVYFLQL